MKKILTHLLGVLFWSMSSFAQEPAFQDSALNSYLINSLSVNNSKLEKN